LLVRPPGSDPSLGLPPIPPVADGYRVGDDDVIARFDRQMAEQMVLDLIERHADENRQPTRCLRVRRARLRAAGERVVGLRDVDEVDAGGGDPDQDFARTRGWVPVRR
jgi:hypothetical protein